MIRADLLQRSSSTQRVRLVVFAIVVFALLAVATSGTPRAQVLVVFLIFVVTATVWVRGQYEHSLHHEPRQTSWQAGAALTALGLAALAAYSWSRWDELFLAGVTLVVFGSGTFSMLWRKKASTKIPQILLWVLVAALLVGGASSALLAYWEESSPALWLLLVAVSLVTLFLSLQPLSEAAINWLSGVATDDRRIWRRIIGIVGGLVFVGVITAAAVWAGSVWVLVLMLLIGLFVVALASSTQADVAAVIGILALMGATPLQASHPKVLNPARSEDVLVALGDSYMSGEGASIYYKGTDEGGTNECRRSPTSWAAMAAQQRPFDGIAFLACSGARTINVRADMTVPPKPTAQMGEPDTQLAQYNRLQAHDPFTADLVVLSIGGNDAGFSTIGLMCLAPGNCSAKQHLWFGGLDQVEALLRATYAEVRNRFPTTPVVVIPYPDPIDNSAPRRCEQVVLSMAERQFISDFLHALNARLRKTADAYGFYYLQAMQNSLAAWDLQLCDPLNDGRPGLNFIGLRSVAGIAEQRFNPANWPHNSLHPNERGHAAMLRVFQNWLSDMGKDLPAVNPESSTEGLREDATDAARSVRTGLAPSPPCDLFDVSPSGCRPQGTRWAQQQIGTMLFAQGWVALLAAGAAWAAAVAFFAWRRSVFRPGSDT